MRFNKLDLNLLVALDAMLKARSISRAAEALHLTQPAMSNALARLRAYFGDDLLVPVGRKMALTPRAETLQEAVRDVLLRVDTTIAALPQFDPVLSDRSFRLFLSDYTSLTLIPHLMALAAQTSGSVRFELLPQVDQPQRALERGEADLLVMPAVYCAPNHPLDILLEEAFCCAVWQGSAHARQGLGADAYAAAGHVVMQPPGGSQPSFESGLMQRLGVVRRVQVSTFSFVSAVAAVVGTEHIATVHLRLARQLSCSLPIALLPLPIAIGAMQQAMQWHKYRSQDPGLVWLRGLMHQAVAAMDAAAPVQ